MTVKLFESMARELVGDGKSPNLYFVSLSGKIQMAASRLDIAQRVAEALGESSPVVLEDRKTGVVWENRWSRREQEAED